MTCKTNSQPFKNEQPPREKRENIMGYSANSVDEPHIGPTRPDDAEAVKAIAGEVRDLMRDMQADERFDSAVRAIRAAIKETRRAWRTA